MKVIIGLILLSIVISGCLPEDSKTRDRSLKNQFTDYESGDDIGGEGEVEKPLRPSGAIYIDPEKFCACKGTSSYMLGNCESFCANKNGPADTPHMYITVRLGQEIEQNEDIENLTNFCFKELDENDSSPNCSLILSDSDGNSINISIEDKNITGKQLDLIMREDQVPKNITFVAYIQSSKGATSQAFQFQLRDPEDEEVNQGPLKIMMIFQYGCLHREPGETAEYFTAAAKQHYYYAANNNADILPHGGFGQTVCHDSQKYGTDDGTLYPRIMLNPDTFALWDRTDYRFSLIEDASASEDDSDNSEYMLIHDYIEKRLFKEYGYNQNINIFRSFSWLDNPRASTARNLGFYMSPWTNESNRRVYCPKIADYKQGDRPVLSILEGIIGDTEAIYLAEGEPQIIQTSGSESDSTSSESDEENIIKDVVIIRENILKQIWFHYENGRHSMPSEKSATTKTVMFYWPPNFLDPHMRGTRDIYTIRTPEEISNEDATSHASNSYYSDKRFGCVPSMH